MLKGKSYDNHRMVWVGRDLIDQVVPTPLPWAGTPSTRPGCLYVLKDRSTVMGNKLQFRFHQKYLIFGVGVLLPACMYFYYITYFLQKFLHFKTKIVL